MKLIVLLAPALLFGATAAHAQSTPLASALPSNPSQIQITYSQVIGFPPDNPARFVQRWATKADFARLRAFGECVVDRDFAGSETYLIQRVKTRNEAFAGSAMHDVFESCRLATGAAADLLKRPFFRASAVRDAVVARLK